MRKCAIFAYDNINKYLFDGIYTISKLIEVIWEKNTLDA